MSSDAPIDVFFSTGEKSGDVLAAAVYRELLKLHPDKLRALALGGSHCSGAGMENIFDRPDLATVEFVVAKYDDWDAIYRYLLRTLNEEPARVFVAVTHHMFNLALAPELPARTCKMLIGPPEIWGWRLNALGSTIANLFRPLTWIGFFKNSRSTGLRRVYVIATSICTVADRGKLPLKHFDKVVCLTPLNYDTYNRFRTQTRPSTVTPAQAGVQAMPGTRGQSRVSVDSRLRGNDKTTDHEVEVVFAGHSAALLNRSEYMTQVASFRRRNDIPDGAHILTILPGSRPGSIRRVLPTALEATVEILNRYPELQCRVSAADETVAGYIESQLATVREKIPNPHRLKTCRDDTRLLLCAGSHAIMSSGTITLEAACLGARGTVIYDLGKMTKLLFDLFCRRMRFGPENSLAPFALPNALYAWLDRPKSQWPYDEFTLKKKYFNAANVIESVTRSLDELPAEYDIETPPTLPPEMIRTIREAFTPPDPSDPYELIAKHILSALKA